MFKNYIVTTIRRLNRQKYYTSVNILGLALGIACCLFIFLIVRYELRFDTFHKNADRIYRIVTDETINDIVNHTMGSPLPMAKALRNDFPQIEKITITIGQAGGQFAITQENQSVKRFSEDSRVSYLEPAFFDIFDFPWIEGDPQSLTDPNNVALTETTAKKFFGDNDALGKTIRMDNQTDLRVTGIVRDFPVNTDFPFDIMISLKSYDGMPMDVWGNLSSNVNTYIVLPPDYSAQQLQSELAAFKNKYFPDEEDFNKRVHKLQPLREIHYNRDYGNYSEHTFSKATLWALALIGVFLLLTACINFINMATAQAINRAKEVGVRKVLGAFRSQLITQYLGETFIVTLFGAALAIVLVELFISSVNSLLRLHMSFLPFMDFSIPYFLILLVVGVSLLAGLYPAFVLSRFVPALAIKNKQNVGSGGRFSLRRGLVILQFTISQMLIIGTIIVTQQMNYFRTKDLGFDQSTIVTVPLPQNGKEKLQRLRTELLQNSSIQNLSFNWTSAASGSRWDTNLRHKLNGAEEPFVSELKFADNSYLATNGIKLIAGRNYVDSDTVSEFVVNETFARKLGFTPHDLIGKMFKLGRNRAYMPVVGVVQDFHTTSFHEEIRPCLMAARVKSYSEASIKISGANMSTALDHIEKTWQEAFPEFVYSYEFLDDRIASFYEEEQKMSQLFRVFSGIAIFIGCIGLLGLISFITTQRTKEIGVRKVLGAKVSDILSLITREFAVLIFLAFLVATPIAYITMQNWLSAFAYRIEIGYGVFALAIGVTLLIAAVTIGYRAIKAALANPVDSLRYE